MIWQETNGHEHSSSYWSKTKISGCRQSSPLVISHHAVFTHKFLALPPLTVLWEFFHVLVHKYTSNQYTEKRQTTQTDSDIAFYYSKEQTQIVQTQGLLKLPPSARWLHCYYSLISPKAHAVSEAQRFNHYSGNCECLVGAWGFSAEKPQNRFKHNPDLYWI